MQPIALRADERLKESSWAASLVPGSSCSNEQLCTGSCERLSEGCSSALRHSNVRSLALCFGVYLQVEFKRLHDGEFPDANAQRRRYLRTRPLRQTLDASMQVRAWVRCRTANFD